MLCRPISIAYIIKSYLHYSFLITSFCTNTVLYIGAVVVVVVFSFDIQF